MLDELDPDRKLFGMTPGAPLTNVPPGGRHWYVIKEVGHPDEDTFVDTLEKLCRFLDDELRAPRDPLGEDGDRRLQPGRRGRLRRGPRHGPPEGRRAC